MRLAPEQSGRPEPMSPRQAVPAMSSCNAVMAAPDACTLAEAKTGSGPATDMLLGLGGFCKPCGSSLLSSSHAASSAVLSSVHGTMVGPPGSGGAPAEGTCSSFETSTALVLERNAHRLCLLCRSNAAMAAAMGASGNISCLHGRMVSLLQAAVLSSASLPIAGVVPCALSASCASLTALWQPSLLVGCTASLVCATKSLHKSMQSPLPSSLGSLFPRPAWQHEQSVMQLCTLSMLAGLAGLDLACARRRCCGALAHWARQGQACSARQFVTAAQKK